MVPHSIKRMVPAALAGLLILGLPALVHADTAADFRRLEKQFERQCAAADYRGAVATANELRGLADGPLQDKPELLCAACYRQAMVADALGRTGDAESLYKKALTLREKLPEAGPPDLVDLIAGLAMVYDKQRRYAEAEPLTKRAIAIREKALGGEHLETARLLNRLAILHYRQSRYAQAEPLLKRVLAIREKSLGPEDVQVANVLNNLAGVYDDQARYAEAAALLERALAIRKKVHGPEHPAVAGGMTNLAMAYADLGRHAEAETLYRRAIAIREKALGMEAPLVANSLSNLANLYSTLGRYGDAEPLIKRVLAIFEKNLGAEHPLVAANLNNLAIAYRAQGRYTEAEPIYKRSLAIREKVLGPEHPDVATSLNNLANLDCEQACYSDAEPLHKRALAIREKIFGPEHPDVATSLNNLAVLYHDQGRYAEAESLHKRALAIREKVLGPEHPDVVVSLNNLATLTSDQGRNADAEPLYRRALAIVTKVYGPSHPLVATSLNNLATVYQAQRRYGEAEKMSRLALAVLKKAFGEEHPLVAANLSNLAVLQGEQHHWAEAESLYQQALDMRKKLLGPDHPQAIQSLINLAMLTSEQRRDAEAQTTVEQALVILQRGQALPDQRFRCYRLRAELHWRAKRPKEAVADLRAALELSEQLRTQASGGEIERATLFGTFVSAFERMVAWQTELGDFEEAFAAAERARARSLVDQMKLQGTSLLAGVPKAEADRLRQRDHAAKFQVAGLQKQLLLLEDMKESAESQRSPRRRQLLAQMAKAQNDVVDVYRDIRNVSPAYRLIAAKDFKPLEAATLRQWVDKQDAILLQYLLGEEGAYLFIVAARREPRVVKLAVDVKAAELLGVDAGPLTAKRMHAVMLGKKRELHALLSDPRGALDATPRLAALWQVLVPEAQRGALVTRKFRRLIVVPDGALALVPFESLVTRGGQQPQYLLDAGPPVLYGPSATVLYRLAQRAVPDKSSRRPVLTVGNPNYAVSDTPSAPGQGAAPDPLAARARYLAVGGRLSPLPATENEVNQVAQEFRGAGLNTMVLKGRDATKARMRSSVSGRQIVHLACHGLTDQSYGNFFGALALTPGEQSQDSADSGFLTLPEIYELDLKGCELAVLSACETNYGPRQRGEGVWTLSRGFLVAGSRRVVASNWLVDDEAAAALIARFCGGLAAAEKQGVAADHAEILHQAKRWVRRQAGWESPFYWGTFVLIGPN